MTYIVHLNLLSYIKNSVTRSCFLEGLLAQAPDYRNVKSEGSYINNKSPSQSSLEGVEQLAIGRLPDLKDVKPVPKSDRGQY